MAALRSIFLIDDSPHDQLLAREAFEQLCPDCILTTALSGEAALNQLRTSTELPQVVLLDVNMPGMNGFDVLRALKAEARLALLPVVMLSTSESKEDVRQAYTLHASSYLVKAAGFAEFVDQIDAFLGYWRTNQLASSAR